MAEQRDSAAAPRLPGCAAVATPRAPISRTIAIVVVDEALQERDRAAIADVRERARRALAERVGAAG